jgi:hypothetical protein
MKELSIVARFPTTTRPLPHYYPPAVLIEFSPKQRFGDALEFFLRPQPICIQGQSRTFFSL